METGTEWTALRTRAWPGMPTFRCTLGLPKSRRESRLKSTASIFSAIWSEYISAKRAGHVAKAAELKAQIDRFDAEVLGG